MRAVHAGAAADDAFETFMDLCVQCRGCEAACPSGVPFGRLMEGTRHTLTERTNYQPWYRRLPFRVLGHHRALLALSTAGAAAQRAHLVPKKLAGRLGLPAELPLRRPPLRSSGTDVWLFTGCVMDAWQRHVHAAAKRLMEATGAGVAIPAAGGGADCCGALQMHAGLVDDTKQLAERVIAAMPGDAPIAVDSAGCGAALKDYGRLLGTPAAEAFARRVVDVHEWLAPRVDALPPPRAGRRLPFAVAVHDPCHLRHVQKAHLPVRTVLAPYADLVELDDDGLCCGAGGAYSVMHPDLAGDIRARKLAAIARTGAPVVASANPGCSLYLGAAGLDVRHPVELVHDAIWGPSKGVTA